MLFRLGAHVPLPGIDYGAVRSVAGQETSGLLQLVDLFSGGALGQLAVFALGVAPYITASIVVQLLAVVIPRLDELRKEGETGVRKLNQWTRYLTLLLAVLQGAGLVVLIASGQALDPRVRLT